MKVIGIVLVLCLAGAMGQTNVAPTRIQGECFAANAMAIIQLGDGCFEMFNASLPVPSVSHTAV